MEANIPSVDRLLGVVQPPERSGDVPSVREMRRGLPKAAGFVDGSLLTWRRRSFQSAESSKQSFFEV